MKDYCGYSIDYNPETISEEYSKILQATLNNLKEVISQYNFLIDFSGILRTYGMFDEYLNKA